MVIMDINDTLIEQRVFFNSNKTKEIKFRINSLKKLRESILSNETDIYQALKADLGKSKFESYTCEIGIVLNEISTAIKNLKYWTKPKKVKSRILNFPDKNYIYSHPYGLTLIISPWNYPFQLILNPLIAAISAGNCAILKPSEKAPNTSKLISKIINETFSKNFVAVIEGGVEVSKSLLQQKFDLIFFTGNSRIGREVMKMASENLTPVILELGGKNPAIIDHDADLETAAKKIVWGKFLNAGQTCIAPDYLLVHSDINEIFLDKLKEKSIQFFTDDPKQSKDYSRIINEIHFDRLVKFLSDGNLYFGGQYDRECKYIAPTILTDINWNSKIMDEEIFGPILPVFKFEKIDEAIEKVKSLPIPLSVYYFSTDKRNQQRIIDDIDFGGGSINDCIMHFINPNLPFGGIGESGIGNYHGKSGFDSFSYQKSILKKGNWIDFPLRYPPYAGKLKWIKKLLK
jgi:aldehyde dehydrogenase (NAD+)